MQKRSKTDNVVRNILWGFLAKILNMLLPFLTRTILIRRMGIEYAGAGGLFTSLLNILNITELGFGSALVYAMYRPMAEGDTGEICRLLNYYRKCYRIIGLVTLALGFVLLPFVPFLVKGNIPDGLNLQKLFLIYLANSVLGYFLFAYKQSLFLASQQVHIVSRVTMLATTLLNALQMASLIFIDDYYVYIAVLPFTTVINNIVIGVLSKKAFPEYNCVGLVSSELKGQMTKRIYGLMLQKIGSVVLKSADTIVISSFMGLTVLGIYNGYYYVVSAVESFISVMNNALIPSVGNSVISADVEENYRLFNKIHFIYFVVLTTFSTCLLTLFQPFIIWWQGKENSFSFEVVILIVITFYLHHICDVAYVYSDAMGLWWKARFINLSAALVNLVANVILVNFIGIFGIMISTIMSLIFVYHTWYTRVLFIEYFKSDKKWLKLMLHFVGYFIGAVIIVGITYIVSSYLPFTGIVELVVKLIISVVVSNGLIWIVFHRTERYQFLMELIRKYIKKVIRKSR